MRRAVQAAILLIAMVLSLSNVAAEQSHDATEADLDALSSATLFLHGTHGIDRAPLLNSDVQLSISGMVARVVLEQTFRNDQTDWVEARYTFPLPDQAAVNSLLIEVGGRTIVGRIEEKQQAEAQYQQAKRAGQVATLVKQHRPNLFSAKVANIAPGETISVKLQYIQTVAYDNNQYSMRIPLTLTQRYSNNTVPAAVELASPQIALPPAVRGERNSHRVTITGTVFGNYDASEFESPSHRLHLTRVDKSTQFSLAELGYLDRDFLLEWTPTDEVQPLVRVWRETIKDEDYILASILPPSSDTTLPRQARELIFVIDTSGSMAGDSMPAAKAALVNALSGLRPDDKFNIIEFNSTHSTLFPEPQYASEENLRAGRLFTKRLYPDGGTEMLPALRSALSYPQTELLRQVVFITDGSVDYEASVVDSVTQQLRGARLFTVGIGAAPNQWFMRKVAEAGRGTAENISDVRDVGKTMARLLNKLEKPALTNISVQIDDPATDVVPNPIPDLYADEPVIVAAKLGPDAESLTVRGTWGDQPWEQHVKFYETPHANTGLSSVWARRKIEFFEDKQRAHRDPDHYKSVILRLALDHQLLSEYTSFVAVEEKVSRPNSAALKLGAVPNLEPAASRTQAVSLPQGSAGSDTLLLLSFIASVLALLLYIRARTARALAHRVI